MKILIISSFAFGYVKPIESALTSMGHSVTVFYHGRDILDFRYKNKMHHAMCFLSKIVGKHPKKAAKEKRLKNALKNENFDHFLAIHPQYLNKKTLSFLQAKSRKSTVYLFDSLKKMPRQLPYLSGFDQIYSYEKADCEKFNFNFITNYIPIISSTTTKKESGFFNISSMDDRILTLRSIAQYLNDRDYPYKFILFVNKKVNMPLFETTSEKIPISDVQSYINSAKVLIDVQRNMQSGLSFRVFEALGMKKKLLTTNADVVNYDFYNPNNILVIDPDNIHISGDFAETDYTEIPKDIFNKYTPEYWAKTVFDLE